MLGRAVSSMTPTDFQPSSTIGLVDVPLMNCHVLSPGPTLGWPYIAVGMHSALDSSMGFPRSFTSASRMLGLVTPPDVSSSFTLPPDVVARSLLPRTPIRRSDTRSSVEYAGDSVGRDPLARRKAGEPEVAGSRVVDEVQVVRPR